MKPLRPTQKHLPHVPGYEGPGPREGKLLPFSQGHQVIYGIFPKEEIEEFRQRKHWGFVEFLANISILNSV